MARPLIANRTRETTTTTGTGTLTLSAVTGYQRFADGVYYYSIFAGAEWEVGIGTVASHVLTRDTVLESTNSNAAVSFSAGTKTVVCSPLAQTHQPGMYMGARLSASNSTAVTTTDQTAITSIYAMPFGGRDGNLATLINGAGQVTVEFSPSGVGCSLSGLTAETNYDFWYVFSGGTLAFDTPTAWTDNTTRATALAMGIDGRWVKTGATNRLYAGTARITQNTGQTEDSVLRRLMFNAFNRCRRRLYMTETADSWSYTTAAFRQWNGNSANKFEFVNGLDESIIEAVAGIHMGNDSSGDATIGIGLDSTTTSSAEINANASNNSFSMPVQCWFSGHAGVGYHYLAALEYGAAGVSWYGDAGYASNRLVAGMRGVIEA